MPAQARNAYEQEREARLEANRRMLQELGVGQAVQEVAAARRAMPPPAARPASVPRHPRSRPRSATPTERRRSGRTTGTSINYREDTFFQSLPSDYQDRPLRRMSRDTALRALTTEEVERIRQRHGVRAFDEAQLSENGEVMAAVVQAIEARASRGAIDSGKGVRIQGGRVYDSKHGITCHWCRQKTLEDHVTCSRTECGGGRRLPTTFCNKCLRNRHGEDWEAAASSGAWVCPMCRGTCGAGCVSCCNCGPCRKKLGLEPTHQIARMARADGFSNVHDYLVHLVTGEDAEAIAARKAEYQWGRWMQVCNADGGEEGGEQAQAREGGRQQQEQGQGQEQEQEQQKQGQEQEQEQEQQEEQEGQQEEQQEERQGQDGGVPSSTAAAAGEAGAGAGVGAQEVADGLLEPEAPEPAAPLAAGRKRARPTEAAQQSQQPFRAVKPRTHAVGKRMSTRGTAAPAAAVR